MVTAHAVYLDSQYACGVGHFESGQIRDDLGRLADTFRPDAELGREQQRSERFSLLPFADVGSIRPQRGPHSLAVLAVGHQRLLARADGPEVELLAFHYGRHGRFDVGRVVDQHWHVPAAHAEGGLPAGVGSPYDARPTR